MFENRLMFMFFVVIIVNLVVGVVSRIFVEDIFVLRDMYLDVVLFKILVFGVNVFVIGLFFGMIL